MLKRFIIGLGTLLSVLALRATEDPQQVFQTANEAYQAGKYAEAIEGYEALVQSGWTSADLYYNLGSSYLQIKSIGPAILNLERALVRASGDPDILHNLQVARDQLEDDISEIPEFFLSRWWRQMALSASSNTWSILGLILLWAGVGGLILWLTGKDRPTRKRGFLLGVPLIVLGMIPLLLAFSRSRLEQRSPFAILQAKEVALHSAPDAASNSVLDLHEGTKVELLDEIGDWYKVRLLNGDTGWLPRESMERI